MNIHEQQDIICQETINGKSIEFISRKYNINIEEFYYWLTSTKFKKFTRRYARALFIRKHIIADRILELADELNDETTLEQYRVIKLKLEIYKSTVKEPLSELYNIDTYENEFYTKLTDKELEELSKKYGKQMTSITGSNIFKEEQEEKNIKENYKQKSYKPVIARDNSKKQSTKINKNEQKTSKNNIKNKKLWWLEQE